ncbi:SDR family oxidoreductase [Actinomadura rayongensis]
MPAGHDETQVVVVGAGPVGLMLAGELRLGGADVVVLERRAEPAAESRASTLHARTMEIFASRGLLDAFGPLPNEPMGHFGGIPLDLTLPGPYPGQWKAPQTRTEAVLADWAGALGADLRRGHELTGLALHPDRVVADVRGPEGKTRVTGRYVVACDGGDSTVRRLTGVEPEGAAAGRELIRADVDGIDIPARRFQRLPRGLAIAGRIGAKITRVMVHEYGRGPSGSAGFADLVEVWRRVTGEDIGHGEPLWVNAFDDAARQVPCYRAGRVLFAGDAAHQQLPVGGQALNLGLQDAVNLGWKLALHVTGGADETLLDTYHAERHAVGAAVLGGIRAQATLLLGDGPGVEALRTVFRELVVHEPVRRRLAATICGLDVRYDVGPAGGPAELGARLAPERGAVRAGRGLLLGRAVPASYADRVDAVPDAAGPAVLARPDGHVVWTEALGEQALAAALGDWFGTPSHTGAPVPGTAVTDAPAPGAARKATTRRRHGMDALENKTALVTGASRGIGRGIAQRLARDGALVAVHYATGRDDAEETVAAIEGEGGRAFTVAARLGEPGDVHRLFLDLERGLKERTGSTELNILVNNAGVMGGVAPEDMTTERFDELFAVNARAPYFIVQRALTNLVAGGRIVNISSGLTRFANPDEIAYAMTKGAVEQLTLHFAKYLAPRGITINSVAPGITRNGNPVFDVPEAVEQMAQLSAFGRVGEPQDIADVVAFLASDGARWVTGAFIDATGGTLLG